MMKALADNSTPFVLQLIFAETIAAPKRCVFISTPPSRGFQNFPLRFFRYNHGSASWSPHEVLTRDSLHPTVPWFILERMAFAPPWHTTSQGGSLFINGSLFGSSLPSCIHFLVLYALY
jgi:hypothetical protein